MKRVWILCLALALFLLSATALADTQVTDLSGLFGGAGATETQTLQADLSKDLSLELWDLPYGGRWIIYSDDIPRFAANGGLSTEMSTSQELHKDKIDIWADEMDGLDEIDLEVKLSLNGYNNNTPAIVWKGHIVNDAMAGRKTITLEAIRVSKQGGAEIVFTEQGFAEGTFESSDTVVIELAQGVHLDESSLGAPVTQSAEGVYEMPLSNVSSGEYRFQTAEMDAYGVSYMAFRQLTMSIVGASQPVAEAPIVEQPAESQQTVVSVSPAEEATIPQEAIAPETDAAQSAADLSSWDLNAGTQGASGAILVQIDPVSEDSGVIIVRTEAYAEVTLMQGAAEIDLGIADGEGVYTYNVAENGLKLSEGQEIRARASDGYDRSEEASTTVGMSERALIRVSVDGVSEGACYSPVLQIEGSADPDQMIRVQWFPDGLTAPEPIVVQAAGNGSFTAEVRFDDAHPALESVTGHVSAAYADGLAASRSGDSGSFLWAREVPVPPDTELSGLLVLPVTEDSAEIVVQTEENAHIVIAQDGATLAEGDADDNGDWRWTLPDGYALPAKQTLSVTATDEAGNSGSAEVAVGVSTREAIVLSVRNVDGAQHLLNRETMTVVGRSQENEPVRVGWYTPEGVLLAEETVQEGGNWKVELEGDLDTDGEGYVAAVYADGRAKSKSTRSESFTWDHALPTPEPTAEPTPEPTAEPTPEPTEAPTPEPTIPPATEAPTAEPEPEPTEEPAQEPDIVDLTNDSTPSPDAPIEDEGFIEEWKERFEDEPMLLVGAIAALLAVIGGIVAAIVLSGKKRKAARRKQDFLVRASEDAPRPVSEQSVSQTVRQNNPAGGVQGTIISPINGVTNAAPQQTFVPQPTAPISHIPTPPAGGTGTTRIGQINLDQTREIGGGGTVRLGTQAIQMKFEERRDFAGVLNHRTAPLVDGMVLGRDAGCDFVITDETVSSRHARITREGPMVFVEDLHSSNGTTLNGQDVLAKMELHSGDVLEVGRTVLKVQF
ncbi:MAG: FHA domain-containing protein [Clostridia bacterium]|nr:FHA domain-containing protein [Clostridia bacterium]